MGELIHKCMAKATKKEGNDIKCSINWALSKRGALSVMSDSLKCGDWSIPYSDIEEATLCSMPWLFMTAYVLRIKSKGQIYQFGLNPGRFWKGELPFAVKREQPNKVYWNIINAIRFIIFGLLIFWIFSNLVR